ncbi:insulin receptor substrate 1 isoform X1 [Drosophila bipectinata]|uniref:insulin receptor substrate 1 isoform X1 n=1 Tax=Drosophila bipectinata TaxID=42026 RepID=UPI001C890C4E|nr:insulin receptor substrate 1 [Drosophila bipectinata]XP_017095871.2 insulin receptor substrate 1 [Drosophila bipectinata]
MASISDDGMVLSGYHKKLKTMKKKFFVLYEETSTNQARLEYYDSEKKFLQRSEPKRVIYLKDCFNINRRLDTKHRFVIVLSSREGGFGIVLESENDLRKWLDKLLFLQRNIANVNGQVYSVYEHVWQVIIQKKGMSEKVGITGTYHCCLSAKSLTFVCIGPEKTANGDDRISSIEILLTTIRRCGHASPQCIFYMELGRQSVLGSGELWMETDNAAIATNMHNTILSAMSAKTDSNTNLINVYQARPDISHEPMRKRSSSANEASKPINVIQNRQNSLELRNCSSPHNYGFPRERCDSLPTRNGTLSESSNQSYFGSNLGLRSNTISGIRPHSTSKHSNSPTFNMPLRCSESEESSISVDESDDNASFGHYRLNTRSSKGAIPEENIDDFSSAEYCKGTGPSGDDNYIPMTPIKPPSFCEAGPEDKVDLPKPEDPNLHINFPEHTSEKLENDFDLDSDNQYGRPIRAYSIGNKVEHLKLNRRLGYINDTGQNSNRVRAYSVGSKSKIPRCDLQRVVLVEDNKFDTNRSHNNISREGPICGTSTNREKKSTSAPLLSLKNQINQDRMSDLMEIDFSQSSDLKPWATAITNSKLLKRNVVEVPKNIENVFPKSYRNDSSNLTLHATSQKDIFNGVKINNTDSSSEGGYLEMKPVGNAFSSSPVTLPSKIEKLKLKDNTEMPVHDVHKVSSYNIVPEKRKEQTRIEEKTLNSQLNEQLINIESANVANIKPNIPELKGDKKNNVEKLIIENNNWDLGTTDEKKLVHSLSSEDYTQIKDKLNDFTKNNEVGYKIQQIKSDSSLISSKIAQKNSLIDNLERQQRLTESANMIPDKSPSAATKGNFYPKANTFQNVVPTTLDNILQTKDLNFPSRPSSQASQPELHYAKLDLPNCSDQKYLKRGSRESPPVATCAEDGNTYARIDFDQSDSSSSSSKIFNM